MKRWKLYFAYSHLPPRLQAVSKPFHDLAFAVCEAGWNSTAVGRIHDMAATATDGPEFTEMICELNAAHSAAMRGWNEESLRRLLRAKDCAVRAHIPDPPEPDAG